jgi:hypothetical protein
MIVHRRTAAPDVVRRHSTGEESLTRLNGQTLSYDEIRTGSNLPSNKLQNGLNLLSSKWAQELFFIKQCRPEFPLTVL